MDAAARVRSILLGLTGMEIDGGIACVARSVAHALDDDVREGHLTRVDRVLLHDHTPTSCPPARGDEWCAAGSQPRFVWLLWRCLRRHRHDLVFFDHYGLARALELPLPGFRRVESAVFTHAFEFRLGFGALRGRALVRAAHVLANSRYSANVVRERLPGLRVAPRVVYLCIDPARERAWSALGDPGEAERRAGAVLCVARMATADGGGKGHDTLLRAWPRVLAAVPTASLWLAGRGDDVPRLRASAAALGIAGQVHFAGYADITELSALYRRAAVYAMPSRQEGFGLVFAEAMWHGLPCVGTTADAARELIVDGETGLLVPFGDHEALAEALVRLLVDPELRGRLGRAGKRRVQEAFPYASFRSALRSALGLDDRPTTPGQKSWPPLAKPRT